MFNDIFMFSLVCFNVKIYSCLFYYKNILVFVYLKIYYFYDIGFFYSYVVMKKKFVD